MFQGQDGIYVPAMNQEQVRAMAEMAADTPSSRQPGLEADLG